MATPQISLSPNHLTRLPPSRYPPLKIAKIAIPHPSRIPKSPPQFHTAPLLFFFFHFFCKQLAMRDIYYRAAPPPGPPASVPRPQPVKPLGLAQPGFDHQTVDLDLQAVKTSQLPGAKMPVSHSGPISYIADIPLSGQESCIGASACEIGVSPCV